MKEVRKENLADMFNVPVAYLIGIILQNHNRNEYQVNSNIFQKSCNRLVLKYNELMY